MTDDNFIHFCTTLKKRGENFSREVFRRNWKRLLHVYVSISSETRKQLRLTANTLDHYFL